MTRWRHPNYGEIAPGDFLKIIKDMRYQYEFDRFVIKKSCQEVRQFINSVHHFSVNISIFTLEQNEFQSNLKNEKILTGIVNMCKDMKIQVVAKGIESIVDVELAKSLGIDYIQGYYYSKPLEKNFFIDYLMNQNDLN